MHLIDEYLRTGSRPAARKQAADKRSGKVINTHRLQNSVFSKVSKLLFLVPALVGVTNAERLI
jgi:hypothetical protein